MDNVYRRDHEMPYIADDAVTSQQKETKKAIREYNETMPFELEKYRYWLYSHESEVLVIKSPEEKADGKSGRHGR